MNTTITQDKILESLDQQGPISAIGIHKLVKEKTSMVYGYTLAMIESLYCNGLVEAKVEGAPNYETYYLITKAGQKHLHR